MFMAAKNKSYSIRLENNILKEKVLPKTIVIYSPDKDFSTSLSMVLQDFFNVLTTNDIEEVCDYVHLHEASLVIADAVPTTKMQQCFERLKKENKHVHLIMIYVSRLIEQKAKDKFHDVVDTIFYKPIELSELIDTINAIL